MIGHTEVKKVLSCLGSVLLLSSFFIGIGISGVGAKDKTTLTVMLGTWWKDQAPIVEEKYEQKARILKAVLTVAPVRGSIKNIQEITIAGTFKQNPKYLPDYVAFIHTSKSVRLPEKIQ